MFGFRTVGLCVAAVLSLGMARTAQADSMLFGSIYDAPAGQIVVAVSTELVTVSVDRTTRVTMNGDPANVADLEPGDRVRLTISRNTERSLIAVDILATRPIAADPLLFLELSAVE